VREHKRMRTPARTFKLGMAMRPMRLQLRQALRSARMEPRGRATAVKGETAKR
jgi:hypothetical protein